MQGGRKVYSLEVPPLSASRLNLPYEPPKVPGSLVEQETKMPFGIKKPEIPKTLPLSK